MIARGSDAQSGHKVHVAIPTLSASRAPNIVRLCAAIQATGASLQVFANGREAHRALLAAGIPVATSDVNLGFAGAVNRAAAARPSGTEWLIVMNDDIETADFAQFVSITAAVSDDVQLVTFGDEPVHRLPATWQVFLSMSMLAGFRRKITSTNPEGDIGQTHYPPFSLVAIRAHAWDALGGLDERFPFSSEDADFVRRLYAQGGRCSRLLAADVRHLRGVTGRANVATVLPASIWGGFQYLQKWEMGKFRAQLVSLCALIVRVPFVFGSRSQIGPHLLGIGRAIKAVASNRRPSLPDYNDF